MSTLPEKKIKQEVNKDTFVKIIESFNVPIANAIFVSLKRIFFSNELYKQKRIDFFISEFINLINTSSQITLEQFLISVSKGNFEPLFLDFLDDSLNKVSLTKRKELIRSYSILLYHGYKNQTSESLFDTLDICSELISKINPHHLLLLQALYKRNQPTSKDELINHVDIKKYQIEKYYIDTGYLLSLGLIQSEAYTSYSFLTGEMNILDSLSCTALGSMVVEKIMISKDY